jgi:hypothetical protein
MFDTTVVKSPDVHVRVEQNPHDAADAARLYGELKRRAEDEVATAVVQKFGAFNELRVVTVESRHYFDTNSFAARVIFDLNGHRYDFIVHPEREKVADAVQLAAYEGIAQEIAAMALRAILPRYLRK